ncbi:MAG: SDR family NAD(P)-dependent oxidoreductase [Chloroflexi bacterium]|nr:SDR family NAD(P)-dependent oxidoreductase [Chloroflexota bacterium]MQC26019.1 SDR family NAD(P)-dependent oxidoreductase [Chloroflexota bacterium]
MSEAPVILITGASSGIGAATAKLFGLRGYRVVLAARRLERLQELEQEIEEAGGEALSVDTDLNDLDQIQALVKKTLKEYGQVDVLLNNAGFGRTKWLEELDPQKDINLQIQVNLNAVIQMTRALLPHMIERKAGHIINMGSMAGFVATPTYTVYAATKHGVRGFADALRREVGVWGIKVSTIYPGGVKTEFGSHTEAKRKTGITTPKSLQLSAEDVAQTVWSVSQRPRRTVIIPWVLRLGAWLDFFAPWLNDWIIERTFTRPERGL